MKFSQKTSCWESDDSEAEYKALVQRGFSVNIYNGEIEGFNANVFGTFIKKNCRICYGLDGNFYRFKNDVWKAYPLNKLEQYLRKILQKPRNNIWKSSYEREYFEVLRRELLIGKPFNSRKELLNLVNGMYSTEKDKLYKHKMKYYSTIRIPVTYDENATCPKFLKYLREVFENDSERIQIAQEWFGYCLSTNTTAQKSLILYGTGANGKGVFTAILSDLVGRENICYIALGELANKYSRVRLFNKTVNISSENEIAGKGLNTQYFKAIVGGDEIDAEEKYKTGFSFKPITKMIFALNSLPSTRDKSEGFFRRLSILHFSTFFKESERDGKLIEKLRTELPGILNWAIEGLEKLRANEFKFSHCKSSEDMLKRYKEEQRPILQFFDERIVAKSGAKAKNSDVLHSFHEWARFNGYTNYAKISARKFWNEMEAICVTGIIKICTFGGEN